MLVPYSCHLAPGAICPLKPICSFCVFPHTGLDSPYRRRPTTVGARTRQVGNLVFARFRRAGLPRAGKRMLACAPKCSSAVDGDADEVRDVWRALVSAPAPDIAHRGCICISSEPIHREVWHVTHVLSKQPQNGDGPQLPVGHCNIGWGDQSALPHHGSNDITVRRSPSSLWFTSSAH